MLTSAGTAPSCMVHAPRIGQQRHLVMSLDAVHVMRGMLVQRLHEHAKVEVAYQYHQALRQGPVYMSLGMFRLASPSSVTSAVMQPPSAPCSCRILLQSTPSHKHHQRASPARRPCGTRGCGWQASQGPAVPTCVRADLAHSPVPWSGGQPARSISLRSHGVLASIRW